MDSTFHDHFLSYHCPEFNDIKKEHMVKQNSLGDLELSDKRKEWVELDTRLVNMENMYRWIRRAQKNALSLATHKINRRALSLSLYFQNTVHLEIVIVKILFSSYFLSLWPHQINSKILKSDQIAISS
jgi:hypothetical protein